MQIKKKVMENFPACKIKKNHEKFPGMLNKKNSWKISQNAKSEYCFDFLQVTDDLEYKKYRQRLTDWEHERERQKHEFVITEDDLDADKRLGSPEITVSSTGFTQNKEYRQRLTD